MTDTDSLAQKVREAVDFGVWGSRRAPALAALDELVGRLDQAERELAESIKVGSAFMARAEKAEREREPWEQLIGKLAGKLREAERENAALKAERMTGTDSLAQTVQAHEDERGVFVYVCDLCGQYLGGPDDLCNSGFHVGSTGETKGHAVASVELVWRLAQAERDLGALYDRMSELRLARSRAAQRR